ncbi:hypothetical protein C6500_11105 [Candidatus Poribacteria bacterium]|nr:MAG: hypothetical protein C6500_11105 [Candidatus Poribacteria bacterium]
MTVYIKLILLYNLKIYQVYESHNTQINTDWCRSSQEFTHFACFRGVDIYGHAIRIKVFAVYLRLSYKRETIAGIFQTRTMIPPSKMRYHTINARMRVLLKM